MILNDEQLREKRLFLSRKSATLAQKESIDLLDTIDDLKVKLINEFTSGFRSAEKAYIEYIEGKRVGFDGAMVEIPKLRDALDAYVQEKVDRAVLAESEWWEHTVGLVHADHSEGFDPECMYCERIAANRAKVNS